MTDSRSAVPVSRRSFLGGAGVATGSMVLLHDTQTALAAMADDEAPPVLGPGAIPLTLAVNGVVRSLAVTPDTTLAEVLRDRLDLTGTKIGCDRGACSACTVWLDGAPVASCMLLAVDAAEHAITTIEGLAPGDTLHPVQQAFIAADALQCGYCTPGMVMSCAALLQRNPHPSDAEVKAAIAGHLCRCGSYPHVLEAMQLAGRAEAAGPARKA